MSTYSNIILLVIRHLLLLVLVHDPASLGQGVIQVTINCPLAAAAATATTARAAPITATSSILEVKPGCSTQQRYCQHCGHQLQAAGAAQSSNNG